MSTRGGTWIWFGQGGDGWALKPVPIFLFSRVYNKIFQKYVTIFRDFSKNTFPFFNFFGVANPRKFWTENVPIFSENGTISRDFLWKIGPMFGDLFWKTNLFGQHVPGGGGDERKDENWGGGGE